MRNQNKKKRQDTGFTLIELLAVITIMGILMLVAIPSISNTIKNSRKDTFKSTAAEINNAVKNAVSSDSMNCACGTEGANIPISGCEGGKDYYYDFDDGKLNNLLDGGAKSPFANKTLSGYVKISLSTNGKYTYVMSISDGSNGFKDSNVNTLKRDNILDSVKTSDVTVPTDTVKCVLDDSSSTS